VSQQTIGIGLGLLLLVFAFLPNEIGSKDSLPIRLDGIKLVLVLFCCVFWINAFWR
jgi:hypothetical protein